MNVQTTVSIRVLVQSVIWFGLLAGAIMLKRSTQRWIFLSMLVGMVLILLSAFPNIWILISADAFNNLPPSTLHALGWIWTILKVAGWFAFVVGFLAYAVTRNKETQNN